MRRHTQESERFALSPPGTELLTLPCPFHRAVRVRLPGLRQGVRDRRRAHDPQAHAQRQQAVQVLVLRSRVLRVVQPLETRASPSSFSSGVSSRCAWIQADISISLPVCSSGHTRAQGRTRARSRGATRASRVRTSSHATRTYTSARRLSAACPSRSPRASLSLCFPILPCIILHYSSIPPCECVVRYMLYDHATYIPSPLDYHPPTCYSHPPIDRSLIRRRISGRL